VTGNDKGWLISLHLRWAACGGAGLRRAADFLRYVLQTCENSEEGARFWRGYRRIMSVYVTVLDRKTQLSDGHDGP